jgi:GDP-L-fucose synthase
MDTNSRIYIAGHRGMVGSAIKRKLEESGYTNLVYSTYEQLDLTRQDSVRLFFENEKPEYVFLAAAKVGGILANNTFRAQFIYENLMIQNNIIHQAYVTGAKKLLFLGSSCIYPRLAPQPLKESYLLTSKLEYTNEPYAIAKIAGIKMIESYNIQYGTDYLAVMPTNLYGPNDNYDLQKSHVLPALIRKIHLAKCLENGDWNCIRKDLQKRPIDNINGTASEDVIVELMAKYGIELITTNSKLKTAYSSSKSQIPNSKPLNTKHEIRNTKSVSLILWGSGTPLREFMHVDDLAAACVHIMEKVSFRDLVQIQKMTDDQRPTTDDFKSLQSSSSAVSRQQSAVNNPASVLGHPSPAITDTHINLGTGVDLSIRELAELIKKTIGFKGIIRWDPSKPDGTPRKLMDVSKMKSLGFEPKVSLEEGIKGTYKDYLVNQ